MKHFDGCVTSGNTCQFCLEQCEDGYQLFTVGSEKVDALVKYICGLLRIEISEDVNLLPKWLCSGCCLEARSTEQFLRSVEASQVALKEDYETEKHQPVYLENKPTGSTINVDRANVVNLQTPKSKCKRTSKLVTFCSTHKSSGSSEQSKVPMELSGKRIRRKPKRFRDEIELKSPLKNPPSQIETTERGIDSGALTTSQPIAEVRSAAGTALGEIVEVDATTKEKPPKKTLFVCEYCKTAFPKRYAFLKHVETHKNCSYECRECLQGFSGKSDFVKHQQETGHVGVGLVECLAPAKERTNMATTAANTEAINIVVGANGQITSIDAQLKTGDEAEQCATDREAEYFNSKYACLECQKEFESPYAARRHYKLVHVGHRAFKCSLCTADFKTKYNYGLHLAVHTGEKRYCCNLCQRAFKTKHERERHNRVHTGEKPYKCLICFKTFAFRCNFLTHKRVHSGERPYRCTNCEATFKTASHLKNHQQMHLRAAQRTLCNETKKTQQILSNASTTTTLPSKALPSVNLQPPKSVSLLKPRSFIISAGSETVPIQYNQIENKSNIAAAASSGSSPYKFRCPSCQKQFKESCALKKHQRTHTGERPYKCPMCPKAFADPSNFKKHKTLHKNATYALKSSRSMSSTMQQLRQMLAEQSVNIVPDGGNQSPAYSVSDPDPDGLETLARLNTDTAAFTLSPSIHSGFDDIRDKFAAENTPSLNNTLLETMTWSRFDNALLMLDYTAASGNEVQPLTEATAVTNETSGNENQSMVCISYQNPDNPIDNKMTTLYVN